MPIKAPKLISALSKNNVQNHHWILFLFALMTSAHAFAQGSKVVGKVVDDHGNAITSVTVLIKDTQFKTLTNSKGNYEITIPETSDNLIFSADGFVSKEINRGISSTINVILYKKEDPSAPPSQVPMFEDVIVQENRLQLPVSQTSRNIHVISNQQIENSAAQSVAELLQSVAGLDIRQRGAHGIQADVSLRGGTFDQILILINGIKMADPQTGHHALNLPLGLDNIERIEILKGPAARVFGANAFTGAINIVTKTPNTPYLKLSLRNGMNALWGGHAAIAHQKGKYQHYLSLGKQLSDGYRFNTDYDVTNYFYQGSYALDESQSISVLGSFSDRKFGANRFYGNDSDFFANQYEEIQTSLMNIGHQKSSANFTIKTRLNWRRNQDEYLLIREDPDYYRNLHTSQVVSLESHGDYYSKWGATGIGGSLSKVSLNSNNLGNRSRQISSLFLEHRAYLLNKKLDITPGVALSHYSDFGSHFFPGIDVGYALKSGIKLFTNMGYTWRIPTYTDLYYVGAANIGNENLIPESALSYEVGAKYTHSHWNTNISWFSRKSSNLIDWIKDSEAADTSKWQPQNLNDLTIRGLDFNINLSGQALLGSNEILENIQIGYTYIDAEIPQYSNIISRYVLENLNHQLTVNIQHRIVGQLHHNLRLRYLDRASMANYFVIDTKLFWEAEKYSFYLTINNLFNESYYESNLVEMPGLWLFAGIKLKIPY